MSFYPSEKSKGLNSLNDVNITTPADGDLLQYNGTDDEWVNSSDVWKTMAQNGAHNLFDLNATVSKYTTTLYERTSTGFRVYNTTSGDYLWMRVPVILPKNTDVVITTDVTRVSGAGIVALRYSEDGNAWTVIDQVVLADSATKAEFTCNTGSHTYYSLWLYCTTDTATTGNITYNNIMIRLASDHNTDYTPYAPTNRDLAYVLPTIKNNGAYNLCPNTAVTHVDSGITFTKNGDGTLGVANTSSASILLTIASNVFLKAGDYRFIGIPYSSNTEGKYQGIVKYHDGTDLTPAVRDRGSNNALTLIHLPSDGYVDVFLSISASIATNFTYKPMITTDLNATYDDFVEYAKTNRELTESGVQTIYEVSTPAQQAANYSFPLSRSIKNAKKLIISYNYGATGYGYSRVVDVPTYFPTILDTIVENAFSSVEVSTSGDYVKVVANGSVNGVFFRKIDAIY